MLKKLFSRKPRESHSDPVEANPAAAEAPTRQEKPAAKPKSRAGGKRKPKPEAKPAPAWSVEDFVVPEEPGKVRFHDLGLDDGLMHAIADLGFQYCSPIQAAVLPHTLRGHDAIGKAQTGTGKTAAFLISVINDLINNPIEEERYQGEPRALVIAPTRELVQQIAEDAIGLTKYTDLNVVTLIGGMDYQKQQNQLARDLVDIVIATPGRLLDFTGRGDLYLDGVEQLVIDEADRMLDMGFIPQVKRIIRLTPKKESRQTLLFSATFTEDIIRLTEQWTYQPVNIEIEPENVATDNVDQRVFLVEERDKFNILQRIIRMPEAESVIVFANRRDQTRRLHERLRKSGIRCGLLSGEIPQNKRTQTLAQFKEGKIQVLVATDVAGRGIHVDGISHVVNFTLPEDPEDYVHRIGRTGRAGAKGTSISFASEDDAFLLPEIEKLLGSKLACEQPPEEWS
ncbi:ATP-dependent RNA helicase RhlB [Litorivivens lipolytica]|uniref:ATP-dependent RNA helicase RhlB n=1 Tax=Litorivivens lipolytica TaxID=1524264 RepID=A0A7W4Z553_9GAMM|nr:ATP-dependent RNA helicase RhlB [Litorivivens lipolytica]MBB3047134.1 ATP-dependent RNA helicase RhlB [Litorivivens lipolytica]